MYSGNEANGAEVCTCALSLALLDISSQSYIHPSCDDTGKKLNIENDEKSRLRDVSNRYKISISSINKDTCLA